MSFSNFLKSSGANLRDNLKARAVSWFDANGSRLAQGLLDKGVDSISKNIERKMGVLQTPLLASGSGIGITSYTPSGMPMGYGPPQIEPSQLTRSNMFPQSFQSGGDGALVIGADQPAGLYQPRPNVYIDKSRQSVPLYDKQYPTDLPGVRHVNDSQKTTFGPTGAIGHSLQPGRAPSPNASPAGFYFRPVGPGTNVVDDMPGFGEERSDKIQRYVKGQRAFGTSLPVHADYDELPSVLHKKKKKPPKRKLKITVPAGLVQRGAAPSRNMRPPKRRRIKL